ncbi:MAG: hypothetical protein NT098_00250 [Candidatus Parcubacteria bacterium]|nr:hypothetical protein [Candidatus Parcubacteria bacterium]
MNTLLRTLAGLVLAIPIITGCTTVPVYDTYGRYQGSKPEMNIGKIAGAATGAAVGGAIGMAVGRPMEGIFLGAGLGGAMYPSEPMYRGTENYSYPQDQTPTAYYLQRYQSQRVEQYPVQIYQPYPNQEYQNQTPIPQTQVQTIVQQPQIQAPEKIDCKAQYDTRVQETRNIYQTKMKSTEQFYLDTHDWSKYTFLKQGLNNWYPEEMRNATQDYSTCLGN